MLGYFNMSLQFVPELTVAQMSQSVQLDWEAMKSAYVHLR